MAFLFTLQLFAQNPNNPVQLALLRWYQVNTVAQFSTYAQPRGMAFDGSHVWVACQGANEVEEFNAADGALVATVSVQSPRGLVYDGAYMWASNYQSGTVTKIAANTATVEGTFAVGANPSSLVFPGVFLIIPSWCYCQSGSFLLYVLYL